MGAVAHLKNSTGSTISKGTVVKMSTAADDSIIATTAGGVGAVGVVKADILAGTYGVVVVAGLAEVLVTGACSRGDILSGSAGTAGQVDPSALYSGAQVIGKAARAAGGAGLVWCEVGLAIYTAPSVGGVPDFNAWRNTLTADDRWYPAGANVGAGPLVANVQSTADHLRAYQFECPSAITIKAVGFHNTNNDGGSGAHAGIYSSKTDGSYMPDQRLVQVVNINMVAGWHEFVFAAPLVVPAGTLLWITWLREFGDGMTGILSQNFRPINGYSEGDITGNWKASIGWEANSAWNAAGMPAAFPASTFLYADGVNAAPLIFVGGW